MSKWLRGSLALPAIRLAIQSGCGLAGLGLWVILLSLCAVGCGTPAMEDAQRGASLREAQPTTYELERQQGLQDLRLREAAEAHGALSPWSGPLFY